MLFGKALKYVFFASFAIAVLYPLVNTHVIFPSFRRLVVNNTEDEAVRVAKSLSGLVVSHGKVLKDPAEIEEVIQKGKKDFNLEKLRVFSDKGRIIYSTDPAEIGQMNTKSYFFEKVAQGQTWTAVVQKGKGTLEGRVVDVDVVETYVPIMEGSDFLGAFEVYYDITLRNKALNDVAFRASLLSFVLVFIFFLLMIIIMFRAEKRNGEVRIDKIPTLYQSPLYLLCVMSAAIFVTEAIVMYLLTILSPQSRLIELVVNASMLVMMVSPFLYFFLLRPLTVHMQRRIRVEEELWASYEKLEDRVRDRTAELIEKNRQLGDEIIERKKVEMDKERLIHELTDAVNKVKTLKGLLPICSSCNKIRDEKGDWSNVDVYIAGHSDAEFTHGYCPDCEKKHFPEVRK